LIINATVAIELIIKNIFVIFSFLFGGGSFSLIKVWTNVLFVNLLRFEVQIKLKKSLIDPCHKFLFHDIAGDTNII
jgi:hypothetical protein